MPLLTIATFHLRNLTPTCSMFTPTCSMFYRSGLVLTNANAMSPSFLI